jgi:adenine-specific DNA methylase
MSDPVENKTVVSVDCPCCGTHLVIDSAQGVVLESRSPVHPRKEASLTDARMLLEEESSRIHERYRQIVEADKGRGATMEKKFKEFLEKANDEPTPRPVRDIDLD